MIDSKKEDAHKMITEFIIMSLRFKKVKDELGDYKRLADLFVEAYLNIFKKEKKDLDKGDFSSMFILGLIWSEYSQKETER